MKYQKRFSHVKVKCAREGKRKQPNVTFFLVLFFSAQKQIASE